MKFLVTFNFAIIQTVKDTLIVSSCGVEAIPVLKGGPVIVLSVIATFLYHKLSKILSRRALFCSVIYFFVIFYAVYCCFIIPFKACFYLDDSILRLKHLLGPKRLALFNVCAHWVDSLFFVVTELWSTMVLLVSFWGFANHITKINEAERFYGIIPMAGHAGLIVGGMVVSFLCSKFLDLSFIVSTQSILVIFCISCGLAIYSFIKTYDTYQNDGEQRKKEDFVAMSFLQSLKQIWSNLILRAIASITVCFAFCMNMVEVGWKSYLKEATIDEKEYQSVLGIVSSSTGLSSLFVSLLFVNVLVKKFGIYFCAQITPIVAAIVSSLFFASFLVDELIISIPLVVILFGAIHNMMMKAMKLSIFDPTRERMYIPLNEDARVTGKAAVDVFCFRFGKSASSWVQLLLIEFIGFGSFLASFDAIFLIVALLNFVWIRSIFKIKGYLLKTNENE
ncbi:NTP/NDP exchange transporter [Candidatus Gromoviella agglomerans]|nr:NTP/NDP exchange transporter [Candidatus Gromoviella agglomerans]